MSISKRLYLVAGLVALLAIAFSAVTLASQLTSAAPSDDPAQPCCAQQDGLDDGIDNEVKVPEADDDLVDEECQCGSQDEADDDTESAANGPDTDNIQEQFGDQNEAEDD